MELTSRHQLSFFDAARRLDKINQFDQLPSLNQLIPWEKFRWNLEKCLGRNSDNSKGGRPPFDSVMMFKILVLQRLYNLSDDQMEYQLNDRMSFQRFAGISPNETVPDAKTIWLFKEALAQSNGMTTLFNKFERHLNEQGFCAKKGTIVDATVIEVPIQHLKDSEKEDLKNDKIPESWSEPKRRQKDIDAKWTKKKGTFLFGYKNHIAIDNKHKLIRTSVVTNAAVHDSKAFTKIANTNNSNKDVWADSAYDTDEIAQFLKSKKLRSKIQKQLRGNEGPPDKYKKFNALRSKIRKRVEHVFGHMQNSMNALYIRCKGIVRATAMITLNNLVYNMCRLRFLTAT